MNMGPEEAAIIIAELRARCKAQAKLLEEITSVPAGVDVKGAGLTPTERRILGALLGNDGVPMLPHTLAAAARSDKPMGSPISLGSIRVQIHSLRRKLEGRGFVIGTAPNRQGYFATVAA